MVVDERLNHAVYMQVGESKRRTKSCILSGPCSIGDFFILRKKYIVKKYTLMALLIEWNKNIPA